MYIYIYIYRYIVIHICTYMCMYIYIYIYNHMYLCIYIYIYIPRTHGVDRFHSLRGVSRHKGSVCRNLPAASYWRAVSPC